MNMSGGGHTLADVALDITVECMDDRGIRHEIDTVLGYRRNDPFAVSMTFVTGEGNLVWTFGRDLLMRGVHSPTGDGDVHVSPAVSFTGRAMVNSGRKRTDIVLATKCNGATGTGPNDRGSSRGHIMDSVKASLKRLGTDYIDLYQIHGIDQVTPVEEMVRAFEDLTRQGHIRYFGVSNWPAWMIMKALGTADRLNAARLVSLQAYYTIAGRDLERDIAPMLTSEKVGLMVWSPLAGGLLSGKYDREGKGPQGSRRVNFDFPPVNRGRLFDCVDVMRGIAKAHNTTVAGIAIAWLLHRPFVTTVIVGAKNNEQLDANLAATGIRLTEEDMRKLDEVSALPPEYPGWMIERLGANRWPS